MTIAILIVLIAPIVFSLGYRFGYTIGKLDGEDRAFQDFSNFLRVERNVKK